MEVSTTDARTKEILVILEEREREAAALRRTLAARETARQVCHHSGDKGGVACALLAPRVFFLFDEGGDGYRYVFRPPLLPSPVSALTLGSKYSSTRWPIVVTVIFYQPSKYMGRYAISSAPCRG